MNSFGKLALSTILILCNLYGQETKAIWVVRDALSSNKVLAIVDKAKELKSNKIFLQLRALGKVYYPTKLDIPKAPVNKDLFEQLFVLAKDNDIEIHAWLNFSYVNSINKKSLPGNHILNNSTNSIIYSPLNGVKSEGYFLHPNDEKNLSEVKTIVTELIKEYPISGIHLDYFRYPKDLSHTSESGRTKYLIEYGLDPVIPINNPEEFIEKRGLNSYTYFKESYSDFLRNELTEALIEIKELIVDKNIQLSVAVKPNPLKAKHQFYQDWPFWINKGYCDFVVIMNYSPDEEIFNNNINMIKTFVNESKITVGIATYNSNKNQVVARIEKILDSEFNGYSLFSYNYLAQKPDMFKHIKQSINSNGEH